LSDYRDKVLLIVNTASACGFTPQYKGLEGLYQTFKDQKFAVLGFPCNQFGAQEPGTEQEIKAFCDINYKVTFPMFAKVDVKGPKAHPLFAHLIKAKPGILGSEDIKWNFTKFLVNAKGEVVKRYAPTTAPQSIQSDIETVLKE
jgi:glutathione peroxidase